MDYILKQLNITKGNLLKVDDIVWESFFCKKYKGLKADLVNDDHQCDFQDSYLGNGWLGIGEIPKYKGDSLKLIWLNRDIEKCYIETGYAFDYHGKGVRSSTKHYPEYVLNCKNKKLIEQCHGILFPEFAEYHFDKNPLIIQN
jgi:hypothetical protein